MRIKGLILLLLISFLVSCKKEEEWVTCNDQLKALYEYMLSTGNCDIPDNLACTYCYEEAWSLMQETCYKGQLQAVTDTTIRDKDMAIEIFASTGAFEASVYIVDTRRPPYPRADTTYHIVLDATEQQGPSNITLHFKDVPPNAELVLGGTDLVNGGPEDPIQYITGNKMIKFNRYCLSCTRSVKYVNTPGPYTQYPFTFLHFE